MVRFVRPDRPSVRLSVCPSATQRLRTNEGKTLATPVTEGRPPGGPVGPVPRTGPIFDIRGYGELPRVRCGPSHCHTRGISFRRHPDDILLLFVYFCH